MTFPMDGVSVATGQHGRPRIAVAGLSPVGTCGVRDHAARLSEALQECGAQVTTVWLDHQDELLAPAQLASMLRRMCRQAEADVVLLHYSVFAYSWRGIPVSVPALALALHRLGVPVVLFAHEFAYPWGRRGWRGAVLSSTQRLAFAPLVAASDAVIVTTEDRVSWIRGRCWLPRRQLASAPVSSNISARATDEAATAVPGMVGIFGFGAEGLLTELVVQAVAQVRRSNHDAHLRLIGAPGSDSPAGLRLQRLADREGCPVSFSGLLDEGQLSQELSSCEVIFHTDPAGPTSRKTTLAAALSHGRPVVAFDGPDRWQELVDEGAVELVPADERAAAALEALLQDDSRKAALAERARAFAAARLSPQHTAKTVLETIDQVVDRGGIGHGRPRVALVAHDIHDRGGMERAMAELIRHCHQDVSFTVVAAELAADLRPLVDRWVRVRVPRRPFPLKFAAFFVEAGLAVRRLDADLVHTLGAIVPNRADVATVQFCQAGFRRATGALAPSGAPALRRLNTSIARALALVAERWSYRPSRLRAFAAVSRGVADEVSRHYSGVPAAVTPNGVDVARFRPDRDRRARLRAELGVGDHQLVTLFVGGDWDRKGLGIAVEAVAKVRADGIDAVLWVIGSGDEPRFARAASGLGIGDAIRFFGQRDDVERFEQAADVFVFPTNYEAFSLAMLEAAASGLALVVPRINGAAELVDEDGGGVLVDRDASDVAHALRTLADQPTRLRLAQSAHARATGYTWARSAESVLALYRSLLPEEAS